MFYVTSRGGVIVYRYFTQLYIIYLKFKLILKKPSRLDWNVTSRDGI